MKAKHYLFATLLSVILTGCYDDDELWDTVNQQATRIEALESWQKETNSNIQALQTLVSTQDFITQVTPVTLSGDTVGYTIAFKNSKSISIYHGQKGDTGEKGEPGIAGTVPTISATQEADGNWYWTLNGTLMKDASGNPVRANGQAGNDALTPLLKTGKELTAQGTSGSWISDAIYLSVDNGTSWTKVSGDDGQDGTDGTDGSSGSNGNSIFAGVSTPANKDDVVFKLSSGEEFQVPKYQALTLQFAYNPFGEDIILDPDDVIELLAEKIPIKYTIKGSQINEENVKISAIITSGSDGSKATINSVANTIQFASLSKLTAVSITATDNAGQFCNYILNLKKSFTQAGTSEADPFIISTANELAYIAKQVNDKVESYAGKYFKLSNDLDLTGIKWRPIGKSQYGFKGTFDGNGYDIRGLEVDLDYNDSNAGLFGSTENATLKNITLISPKVKNDGYYSGSLVGYSHTTIIDNCNVTDGYCSADWGVGGLIGMANGKSTITNCHVKETTVTARYIVGGLIGSVKPETNICAITNCSATGCELNAGEEACGGLIGRFYITTLNLTACYATGSINSPNNGVGALLGEEVGSFGDGGNVTMTGCYSTVTHQNGDASFTLQGGKTENGTSTFKACYYITDERAETVDGITYQEIINDDMIREMNKACGKDYYDEKGALISREKEL